MKDVLTGTLMLAVVISFWVQGEYRFPHTNLLPDATLVVLAVLSLWLVVHGWFRRYEAERAEDDEEALRWVDLARAVALLSAWVIALPLLGFVVGSIVFATVTSVSMRTERPSVRRASVSTCWSTPPSWSSSTWASPRSSMSVFPSSEVCRCRPLRRPGRSPSR